MSDERITFEERCERLENRFIAVERRFAALEECTERMLSLVMRIAER